MKERKVRWFCAAMVLFAVGIRGLGALGYGTRAAELLQNALASQRVGGWLLRQESGGSAALVAAEPEVTVWPVRILAADAAEVEERATAEGARETDKEGEHAANGTERAGERGVSSADGTVQAEGRGASGAERAGERGVSSADGTAQAERRGASGTERAGERGVSSADGTAQAEGRGASGAERAGGRGVSSADGTAQAEGRGASGAERAGERGTSGSDGTARAGAQGTSGAANRTGTSGISGANRGKDSTAAARRETIAPPTFSAAEADAIAIGGASTYSVDKRTLLTRETALELDGENPKVLIVHTHSCEAYTPEEGWEYTSSDPFRTEDAERSVIRIGTRLTEILNEYGVGAIHVTELNDSPSYNGAYERMRQTIEAYLAKYPSIQMVLDVHRDAADDPAGMPVSFAATVDGARCAQLMLVVGTDEGGLTHPDWQENLANALKMQALLNRMAPGLCRDIDLRTERFNQHETPGSLLVEFGCTGNTLAEALRSAEYFGQAVCQLWGVGTA